MTETPHPERVPNAETASFTDDRLVTYVLNPDHEQGRSKATFFALMGYDKTRALDLETLFLERLPYVRGHMTRYNPKHGQNWEAIIEIPREGGRVATVTTVWEVHLTGETRFLTAHPYRRKR